MNTNFCTVRGDRRRNRKLFHCTFPLDSLPRFFERLRKWIADPGCWRRDNSELHYLLLPRTPHHTCFISYSTSVPVRTFRRCQSQSILPYVVESTRSCTSYSSSSSSCTYTNKRKIQPKTKRKIQPKTVDGQACWGASK